MAKTSVSLIMCACNQGHWLKETVDSAVKSLRGCSDWEIIIIDDQSSDGCCDYIDQTDRIKVHRPEQKLGISHARHLAGTMAKGDILITADTHCEFPEKGLWRLADSWAIKNRAVICPVVDHEVKEGFRRIYGGKLTITGRGIRMDRPRTMPEPYETAMWGSIYLMRRDVWDWMGGWIRLPGYWGGDEQMMSILAYRIGIPIIIADTQICKHFRYRDQKKFPFHLPEHHPPEIYHYIHATLFPKYYKEIWAQLLESYYGYSMSVDPKPLRAWIERRSIRSEEWFVDNVLKSRPTTNIEVLKQISQAKKEFERREMAKA